MAILEWVLKGFTSWKTTAMGIAVEIGYLGQFLNAASQGVTAIFDGDPTTSPDWIAMKTSAALVAAGFGLIFARDNNKSSEDVGAGK